MAETGEKHKILAPVKDSGWSWVILAAGFFTQTIIFGLLLCFGIYFVTFLEYFHCTKGEVAAIGSIAYGTKCLTVLWGGSIFIVFSMANNLMIKHGITKTASTFIVSLLGFGSFLGRFCSSIIGNFSRTNRPLFYAVATWIFGCAALVLTFCYAEAAFGLALLIYGFFFGCMLSQLAGVIMDLFGVGKLVNGIGYSMFAVGLGVIVIPCIGGILADKFGTEAAYYFSGALALLAASFCFANVLLRHFDLKMQKETEMEVKNVS